MIWMYLLDYFFHFFHTLNLVIFQPQYIDSGYLVSTTPQTILYLSFWNLDMFFFHILKMCMCFSHNPCHIFCHFFILFELCHLLTSDV